MFIIIIIKIIAVKIIIKIIAVKIHFIKSI